MNLIKHRKKERQLLLLVTVFTSVFVLTWMTPLVADDFNYAFSWLLEHVFFNGYSP